MKRYLGGAVPLTVNEKILMVSVYAMLGNQRFSSDWDAGLHPEKQLDMTGFASGMCLLVISDGDRQVVRKIVKQ